MASVSVNSRAAIRNRLFDYNLDDLRIDESPQCQDWDVKHGAGRALAGADKKTLAILFDRLLNSDKLALGNSVSTTTPLSAFQRGQRRRPGRNVERTGARRFPRSPVRTPC